MPDIINKNSIKESNIVQLKLIHNRCQLASVEAFASTAKARWPVQGGTCPTGSCGMNLHEPLQPDFLNCTGQQASGGLG